MNQKQREYAINRIQEIALKKATQIKEQGTTKAKKLSRDEKHELIKNGSVTLKSDLGAYTYVWDAYDFSEYESSECLKDGTIQEIELVHSEARKAADKIMLGTSPQALAAITSFEERHGLSDCPE